MPAPKTNTATAVAIPPIGGGLDRQAIAPKASDRVRISPQELLEVALYAFRRRPMSSWDREQALLRERQNLEAAVRRRGGGRWTSALAALFAARLARQTHRRWLLVRTRDLAFLLNRLGIEAKATVSQTVAPQIAVVDMPIQANAPSASIAS